VRLRLFAISLSALVQVGSAPDLLDRPLPPLARAAALDIYRGLPLMFEANRGQVDGRVEFLARTPWATVFLTAEEMVIELKGPQQSAVLRMTLAGANPAVQLAGRDDLAGKVHYIVGNVSDRWRSDVPLYAKVHAREVYAGVDMVFYGAQGQLEYDFIVAPGSDPGVIRVGFEGTDAVRFEDDGSLALEMGTGMIRQEKPGIYQEKDGVRTAVSGGYVRRGDAIGFEVGSYDASRPLVIDPVLAYSTYLGGGFVAGFNDSDQAEDIAVDAQGNAFVTGLVQSPVFPVKNAFQPNINVAPNAPSYDAFVTKLNTNASGAASLVYSTYLGGTGEDFGFGIALFGPFAFVTGRTDSQDFPMQHALFPSYAGGFKDVFFAVLTAPGSSLLYSTYLGGSGDDGGFGMGIAVDNAASAYITGQTSSIDFNLEAPYQPVYGGGSSDAFVTKLALDPGVGFKLAYSTYLGGVGSDRGTAIAFDAAGNASVAGVTGSANFPLNHALQPALPGGAFVTKFNASGSGLIYSSYLGGTAGTTEASGIAVDVAGSVYVTGFTTSVDFPTHNPLYPMTSGGYDAFLTKLALPTNAPPAYVYSTYLGGSGTDFGLDVAVDGSGRAHVTGSTTSTNFKVKSALQPAAPNCVAGPACTCRDAFISKINAGGSALLYSSYLGGGCADEAKGIAVDAAGSFYAAGATASTNFPTKNAFQPAIAPNSFGTDAFVSRFRLTTPEMTIYLIGVIQILADLDILTPGEQRSLTAKLQTVVRHLERGDRNAAFNQVRAFSLQLQALDRSRDGIPRDVTRQLTELVDEILRSPVGEDVEEPRSDRR
jgi:hypothetical protein